MKFDQKCYLRNKFTKVIVYNQVLERVGVIVELSSEVKPIIFASFFLVLFFCHERTDERCRSLKAWQRKVALQDSFILDLPLWSS